MTSSVPHRKESRLTDQVQNCAGFRLSLFGGPRLEQGERQLRLSPLQSALLGIVATCGRSGIPRGRLLSLLWRMGTDAQLRRRLSQLVYSFRKRLSGKTPILAVGDHYLLDSENVISDLVTASHSHSVREPYEPRSSSQKRAFCRILVASLLQTWRSGFRNGSRVFVPT